MAIERLTEDELKFVSGGGEQDIPAAIDPGEQNTPAAVAPGEQDIPA